jgi:hypothetical protein
MEHNEQCPCRRDRSAGRWCAVCNEHGSHHTERHDDFHNPLAYCWHHGYEPDVGAFRVCGECAHAFMTEEELISADAQWREGQRVAVDDITCCPLCTHDW